MILVLSTLYDSSTRKLIYWLEANGVAYRRLNGEDFDESLNALTIGYEDGIDQLNIIVDGEELPLNEIKLILDRRTHSFTQIKDQVYPEQSSLKGWQSSVLYSFLTGEFFGLYDYVSAKLKGRWLDQPQHTSLNKLSVLDAARAVGLKVPATIVTNKRQRLQSFVERYGTVITKPVAEVFGVEINQDMYMLYTPILTLEDLTTVPESFFPSLFQQCIEKIYEIRSFYLAGEFYSMTIFSQLDESTQADFRNYNRKKWNRMVPFKLPLKVEQQLHELMKGIGLTRGSIDLIKALDGQYFFLEVNPVGQFGMTSKPCNYFLEEKIVKKAIAYAEEVN